MNKLNLISLFIMLLLSVPLLGDPIDFTTEAESPKTHESVYSWPSVRIASACPDVQHFDSLLTQLLKNRVIFNTYNDSIYVHMSCEDWVAMIQRRAQVVASIYNQNRQTIIELKQILAEMESHDLAMYRDSLRFADFASPESPIKDNCRLRLIYYFFAVANDLPDLDDPFLAEDLLTPLAEEIERLMPHSDFAYLAYGILQSSTFRFAPLNNEESIERCRNYCLKTLKFESAFPMLAKERIECYLHEAYYFLTNMTLVRSGVLSLDEIEEFSKGMAKLKVQNADYYASAQGKFYNEFLTNIQNTLYSHMLSGYVWPSDWHFHSEATDEYAQKTIQTYNEKGAESGISFYQNLKAGLYLNKVSADDAWSQSLKHAQTKPIDFTQITRRTIYKPALQLASLAFFLDEATIPEHEKTEGMRKISDYVIELVRSCRYSLDSHSLTLLVSSFFPYSSVMNHLPAEEALVYMRRMFVASQMHTMAHSQMVGRLSCALFDGVVEYRPDLLKNNPFGVKRNKNGIDLMRQFMYQAGLNHDLGKMMINEIVDNEFRPLTALEYSFLESHTERALRFLRIDPSMKIYNDCCLGHHKWYNNHGGYPEWFDITKSPYRIFIDILGICDCLEAATNQLGRKYAQAKSFEQLIHEFEMGAGTRYNPHLVEIITTHPDVYSAMKYLVEKGWEWNYYSIYQQYFE